jgi:hypothetical protein
VTDPAGTDARASGVTVAVSGAPPDDWPALLAAGFGAEYTHSRHWTLAAVEAWPGCRPVWLTARLAGKLVGGVAALSRPVGSSYLKGLLKIERLESSLDGTTGGPLIRSDLAPALQDRIFLDLTTAFLERRHSGPAACTLALNRTLDVRFGSLLAQSGRWQRHDAPTAVVDLGGGIENVAAKRLNRTKRNERNRGLRQGAEVFATTNQDLVRSYYPLYLAATGHWGTTPVPLEFLCRLLEDPHERCFFVCVRLAGKVIGGHLNLHYGDRVFAWNGVTDPLYARTHYPATLVFWGDMVEACRRGARWFDLGGSGGVQSLTGFKKYLGAEIEERGFYTHESRSMAGLRTLRSFFGRFPGGGPAQRWHDRSEARPVRRGTA